MEGQNPTRRYKWFRPRQAARGAVTGFFATNYATISLFNTSQGPHVLVVRDFRVISNSGGNFVVANVQGSLGSAAGTVANLFPADGAMPGQTYRFDNPNTLTADYGFQTSSGFMGWPHDLPFGFIQPGWSLAFQSTSTGQTIGLAFLWEAIGIDELDFLDW